MRFIYERGTDDLSLARQLALAGYPATEWCGPVTRGPR